jgi:hypothetical protein
MGSRRRYTDFGDISAAIKNADNLFALCFAAGGKAALKKPVSRWFGLLPVMCAMMPDFELKMGHA